MAPARTLTERESIRQRLRDHAMAHALDSHMTARCRWASECGTPEADHQCVSFPGSSAFCLCTCHDSDADGTDTPGH